MREKNTDGRRFKTTTKRHVTDQVETFFKKMANHGLF